MPKDRRDRSRSSDRHTVSPYRCSSSHARQTSPKFPLKNEESRKEWEEARCPVCMEHPHNAVLLVCSSHENGCRPYMCDTSYRHSNCLDKFRKAFAKSSSTTRPEGSMLTSTNLSTVSRSESTVTELQVERNEQRSLSSGMISSNKEVHSKLVCPLCRGQIKEWIVTEPARQFMNAKPRCCSCETCDFIGTYSDLRKHARLEHPLIRPSEADPRRQRDWRRLERQRDLGDLLSTLQSSAGEENGDSGILPIDDGGWLTVFFLIRVFQSGSIPIIRSWPGMSRASEQLSFRRRSTRLWGETHDLEIFSSSEEDDDSSDGGSPPLRRSDRVRQWRTLLP
uniref:Uncharacterized protein n=1 Tax=Rhizophora mucronata TaxID=61149 RepID=A0A2P2MDT5_RHIMU